MTSAFGPTLKSGRPRARRHQLYGARLHSPPDAAARPRLVPRGRRAGPAARGRAAQLDPRPQVLYLRGFRDDSCAIPTIVSGRPADPGAALADPDRALRGGRRLGARRAGPVVAIAPPGAAAWARSAPRASSSAPTGSGRSSSPARWAQRLVVMSLAASEGALWELAHARGARPARAPADPLPAGRRGRAARALGGGRGAVSRRTPRCRSTRRDVLVATFRTAAWSRYGGHARRGGLPGGDRRRGGADRGRRGGRRRRRVTRSIARGTCCPVGDC